MRIFCNRVGRLIVFAGLALLIGSSADMAGAGDAPGVIPPLQEVISLVKDKHASQAAKDSSGKIVSERESVVSAKKYYFQIQAKTEQISIAEEVKGHFEKAVNKAEEKIEKGEEDVSQSSLTKLKLGLTGTLHDLAQLRSDLQIAKLNLGHIIGRDFSPEKSTLAEDRIKPLEFSYKNFEEYERSEGGLKKSEKSVDDGSVLAASDASRARGVEKKAKEPSASEERRFAMQKAFIKVIETRQKLDLAEKTRKMTRALLVAEVANYDFGIGKSEDLFEALIIYTKVLSGYYDSVFNYNMAVVELQSL